MPIGVFTLRYVYHLDVEEVCKGRRTTDTIKGYRINRYRLLYVKKVTRIYCIAQEIIPIILY